MNKNRKFRLFVVFLTLFIAIFINIHAKAQYTFACIAYVEYKQNDTFYSYELQGDSLEKCEKFVNHRYSLWLGYVSEPNWNYFITYQDFYDEVYPYYFYGRITYPVIAPLGSKKK